MTETSLSEVSPGQAAVAERPSAPRRAVRRRLVLASALMLLLELALIRWLGANVIHLSYFSDVVLLGSFLGVGLGFLRTRPGRRPPMCLEYLALLVGYPLLVGVAAVLYLGAFFTSRDRTAISVA